MTEQERAARTHALVRTSPKGTLFIGTCTQCGTKDLPMRAALEPCPNQRALTRDGALLEVLGEAMRDADIYKDDDMAAVGRALMAAIKRETTDQSGPLFGWHPADCPSEVVGDLVEMLLQARTITDDMVETACAAYTTEYCGGEAEWPDGWNPARADDHRAAIRPGDRLPAGVVLPEEPTEALLSEFGKRRGWGLSYKCPFYSDDDDEEQCWQVTEVRGSVNDREWYVLGKGETPADAIRAAIAAAKETTR